MRNRYWYAGGNGASFVDAKIHRRRDCPEFPDEQSPRPLAGSTVADIDPQWCVECSDDDDFAAAETDDTDTEDEETEDADADEDDETPLGTCDVVKQDGEVCGRERPCRFHD